MSRYTYFIGHPEREIGYGCDPVLGYYFNIFERVDEPSAFGYTEEPSFSLCTSRDGLTGADLATLLKAHDCENWEHVAQAFFDRQF